MEGEKKPGNYVCYFYLFRCIFYYTYIIYVYILFWRGLLIAFCLSGLGRLCSARLGSPIHPSIVDVMRSIFHCDVGRSGVWLMSRAATILIFDCGGCGAKDRGLSCPKTANGTCVTCDRVSHFNESHNFAKESGSTRLLAAAAQRGFLLQFCVAHFLPYAFRVIKHSSIKWLIFFFFHSAYRPQLDSKAH